MTYSLKKDGERNLTTNFKIKEFACKDGTDDILINEDAVCRVLQPCRTYLNEPLQVVCGYRTQSYNQMCGGASNSYHCQGRAYDVRPVNYTREKLWKIMMWAYICKKRAGIYINRDTEFVHIDDGDGEPVYWINDKEKGTESYFYDLVSLMTDGTPYKVI